MRKTVLILAISVGSIVAPTFVQTPAEARVFWSVGSVFSVGGLDFALVFGDPTGLYADGYFYRTLRPLHHHGYSCHNGCSYRDGYYYHHPDCSVVRYHFRRYSFAPDRHLRSAPWYFDGGRYYERYRPGSAYYDRYRYDRGRYDRQRSDRYRYERHRLDGDRGRRPGAYGDRGRGDQRRSDGYRRDDRGRRDRDDAGRRRGSDSRSRSRRGH